MLHLLPDQKSFNKVLAFLLLFESIIKLLLPKLFYIKNIMLEN